MEHRFFLTDIVSALKTLQGEGQEIQTAFFDPPYNIGFRYSAKVNDKLPENEYHQLIGDTFEELKPLLSENGSAFLVHYPEASARLLPIIESKGYRLHQWISWVYPSNIGHTKKRFTTAHRALLWFTHKDCEQPLFHAKRDPQSYKNPEDPRVQAQIAKGNAGTTPYDWWEINMVKAGSREHNGWYNQIPYLLIKRMILCTSEQGDTTLDGFAGSCSMWPVCEDYGRQAILVDLDPESKIKFDEFEDVKAKAGNGPVITRRYGTHGNDTYIREGWSDKNEKAV